MILSPQTKRVYRLLLQTRKPLFVKEIAKELKIPSNNVYRLVKPLIEMGLVKKNYTHPSVFSAKPEEEALGLFLLSQTEWFHNQFASAKSQIKEHNKTDDQTGSDMQFSFIKGRDELMNVSAQEIDQAHQSVDLLRSGHEMTPEVVLAIKQALKRQVTVRMIIQDYGPENAEQVVNWQKNGILVRKTSLKHLRLMVYDAKNVYFMSYKYTDSGKDLGMKITYPPLAVILKQFLNQLWEKAEEID